MTNFGEITPDSPITPDNKDWTWVLEKPCPECGHVSATAGPTEVGAVLADVVAALTSVLERPDVAVRPTADRWSDLEYVCHVRDVFDRFEGRIDLMVTEDDPLFANWDQDVTALEENYSGQDPAVVAAELDAAARSYALRVASLTPDQLERPGRRSDGASFTVDTLVRYMLHDPVHHVWDVTDGRPSAP
jgi:hypothetical protein